MTKKSIFLNCCGILWIDIPHTVTLVLSALCFAMMTFSFIQYFKRNWHQLRK